MTRCKTTLNGSAAILGAGIAVAVLAGAVCRPRLARAAEGDGNMIAAGTAAAARPGMADLRAYLLAQSNPCAPKKANPCKAKNPCAAKNPCKARNPCAAKNPCGAANPCNPCGGGAVVSAKCAVPRLAKANPAAAKNPCAPKKGACNPCNPCGAAESAEITAAEATKAYQCVKPEMKAAYVKSGHPIAKAFDGWARFNTAPYQSATHGSRYVNNYANATGKAYGRFEAAGKMPIGTQLAKDSFLVTPDGKVAIGPLFLMEKMKAGFNAESGDWRYTMIMPDGTIAGATKGKGDANMAFCASCHMVQSGQDSLFFMPGDVRRTK